MRKWTRQDILTIPNLLSAFRIVLAVLIPIVFYHEYFKGRQIMLAGIVALSGVTDFLDGKIARHFNMVSDFGKVLDPIADKVTQLVLLICLLGRSPAAVWLLVLLVLKELIQAFAAYLVLRKTKVYDGARWYGKVNTVLFYLISLTLLFFPNLPNKVTNTLLIICGASMLTTFILYLHQYCGQLAER